MINSLKLLTICILRILRQIVGCYCATRLILQKKHIKNSLKWSIQLEVKPISCNKNMVIATVLNRRLYQERSSRVWSQSCLMASSGNCRKKLVFMWVSPTERFQFVWVRELFLISLIFSIYDKWETKSTGTNKCSKQANI